MGTYDTHHGGPISPRFKEETMDVLERLDMIRKQCEPLMNEHFEVSGMFFLEFVEALDDAISEINGHDAELSAMTTDRDVWKAACLLRRVPPASKLGTDSALSAKEINPDGADQGSVRNATDELAAKAIAMLRTAQCPDQRCSDGWIIDNGPDPQHDSCEWCYGRQMLIDAAIRALPVLEAHQKD